MLNARLYELLRAYEHRGVFIHMDWPRDIEFGRDDTEDTLFVGFTDTPVLLYAEVRRGPKGGVVAFEDNPKLVYNFVERWFSGRKVYTQGEDE